jgi:hypothetical protein
MITHLQWKALAAIIVIIFVAAYLGYRRIHTGRWL